MATFLTGFEVNGYNGSQVIASFNNRKI